MGTAPDKTLPFSLKIQIKKGKEWVDSEEELDFQNESCVKLQEQKEYKLVFLYENADTQLDIPELLPEPADNPNEKSNDGRPDSRPHKKEFILFENTDDFTPLRVGTYDIRVQCDGKRYTSTIAVIPNPDLMTWDMWRQMRDELEDVSYGLAQDIVRRSMGFGGVSKERLPVEKLYRFMVFQAYNPRIFSALMSIQDSPKSRIVTKYEELPADSFCRRDPKSIRMTLTVGGRPGCVYSPKKYISYDIPENRLLKKIITVYDRELADFLEIVNDTIHQRICNGYLNPEDYPQLDMEKPEDFQLGNREHKQFRESCNKGLIDFKRTAEKLCRTTQVIKRQEWYAAVDGTTMETFSHSFAMDARYGVLLHMYQDLRQTQLRCRNNAEFSFSWKASHELYEMWCFVKICQAFLNANNEDAYEIVDCQSLVKACATNELIPYLIKNSCVSFSNRKYHIDLLYNANIPTFDALFPSRKKQRLDMEYRHPFFFSDRTHTNPDITMNIFLTGEGKKYLGSVIFDSKYRDLWDPLTTTLKSDILEQISCYYFNSVYTSSLEAASGDGFTGDGRPVKKVVALAPCNPEVGSHTGVEALPYFSNVYYMSPGQPNAESASVQELLWSSIQYVENLSNHQPMNDSGTVSY